MMLKRSRTLNLKPSGKVILGTWSRKLLRYTSCKSDGLRVDWMEQHHVILRNVIMSYPLPHYKVALVDHFGKVNVTWL